VEGSPHPHPRPPAIRGGRTTTVLAALMLLAGCGGSPTARSQGDSTAAAVYSKFANMPQQQRQTELVKAARSEGALSVYSAYNDEARMAHAFEQRYGIKVNVYVANSENVLQRVQQEANAHYRGNDVYVGPEEDLTVADQQGLFGEYRSALADQVPASGRGKDWTAVRRLAFIVGYNTSLVPPGTLPTTVAGFADPKWRGKISMELSDYDWFMAMVQDLTAHGMTRSAAIDLFKRIAANAKIVKGHTVQGNLLSAGQTTAAVSVYTQTVDRLAAKHAPVSWGVDGGHVVQPVVVRYDASAVMADARHPAAALLYQDFELGADGAAVDKANNSLPAIPGANDPLRGLRIVTVNATELAKDRSTWSNLYDQVVQGGAK
jgi:iron(III) transport system substrate-binding protein